MTRPDCQITRLPDCQIAQPPPRVCMLVVPHAPTNDDAFTHTCTHSCVRPPHNCHNPLLLIFAQPRTNINWQWEIASSDARLDIPSTLPRNAQDNTTKRGSCPGLPSYRYIFIHLSPSARFPQSGYERMNTIAANPMCFSAGCCNNLQQPELMAMRLPFP